MSPTARPRWTTAIRIATLVVVVLAVGGCLPAARTTQGQAISDLWSKFMIAAALVGGLVWVLITVAILRYRRRPGDDDRLPPQIGHVTWLEVVWTVLPIATILVLFGLTLSTLGKVDAFAAAPPVTVNVTAFRWQWRFDYAGTNVSVAGGPDTPAEMVVPVGEPVHIVLTSADVDHSFYVPAFLFKRDAIPGRTNAFDLTITDPGTYSGQCAEFCGVFHDRMTLTVRAVTRPEFDAWLRSAASGQPASAAPASSLAPLSSTSNAAAPSAPGNASQQP
jgi:cytochrome c oxidase subunit II